MKKRVKPPAFQFYVKDWLSGTRALSFAEKGMYIDLLAWSWDNGPLPAAPRALAAIVGIPLRDFEKLWRGVSSKFVRVKRAKFPSLVNPRLEKVRSERKTFLKKQRINGAKGGRPKKPKNNPTVPEIETQRVTQPETQTKPLQSAVCDLQSKDPLSPQIEIDREIEDLTHTDPRARELRAAFEAFWALYPKKTRRANAHRMFLAIRPSRLVIDAIFAALDWQVKRPEWLEQHGRFVPQPEKWLSDRRWEDEPPTVKADESTAESLARILAGGGRMP